MVLRYVPAVPVTSQNKVLGIRGVASADELREEDAARLTHIGKMAARVL